MATEANEPAQADASPQARNSAPSATAGNDAAGGEAATAAKTSEASGDAKPRGRRKTSSPAAPAKAAGRKRKPAGDEAPTEGVAKTLAPVRSEPRGARKTLAAGTRSAADAAAPKPDTAEREAPAAADAAPPESPKPQAARRGRRKAAAAEAPANEGVAATLAPVRSEPRGVRKARAADNDTEAAESRAAEAPKGRKPRAAAVPGRRRLAEPASSPAKAAARKPGGRRKAAGTEAPEPTAAAEPNPPAGKAKPTAPPARGTVLARVPSRAVATGEESTGDAKKRWDPLAPYKRASEKLMVRMRPEKLTTPAKVIEAIRTGPQGPQVIAAFDFDGTLVGGFTGAWLMQERMKRKEVSRAEIVETAGVTFKAMAKLLEANEVVRHSMAQWAGKSHEEMEELGDHLFENKIQDAVFPEMREILAAHRVAGHTIVVATSASRYQVEPTVKSLGIDKLLCTEIEVAEGKLTGNLVGDSLFGAGKVAAIKKFVAENGGNLADTHFYADGDEEVGLMEAVGYPHPTNPGRKLAEAARAKGWSILRFQSRGSAKPGNFVRGIVGLASILPILQAGLAVGLLTRDKRQAANLIMPTWIQAQLNLAKVKLRVSGRKNLHARRPAVFIFNHRNNYDGSFVACLVRTDYVSIAKADMAKNPVGKLVATIMPTVFIDRGSGDAQKAADALQPVVEAVEKGYSIMLAPEGTRVSGNPGSVGPFKKGAFHMAMAAGIPVVPVVIRNALDVAARDAGAMRPGTVDIAVLPPVSVADWTRENMGEKIEEVRQQFIETLNDWPEPDEDEEE